jgi:ankyrin repeat protein
MKSALESSVPSQLFDVYETVMETISQSSDDSKLLALTILSWLFYAKRPLQITELREAIAVRDGDVDIEEEDMMLPEDIVEVCGSFVALDRGSGVVGFSHQTVQEFLRTRYLLQLLPEQDMAKTCLTYLLFDEFENGPSSTESSFQERFRQRPFGRYAARFWGVHIKQADVEMDIGIQTMLVRLIGSSYKLDAMSQLARAETAADWDDERSGWERKKALIHILAENNFVKLARAILPQETIVVTLDRPTEEILILGDGQLDVEQRTQTGWTALHFAAKEGSVDMIDLLLSAKAEVEAQTENGHRPLAIAAFRGHKKAVMKFLDAKADVQARSLRGASALYHAAGNGHLEVVDILLKANGDVTAEVDLGIASLQRASIGGHVYVVKRLLKAGAQVDAHANIASALSCAAIRGHIKVVNVLLEANADVNIQDDVGCGALHFAARNGHTEVVQRLLEANADVNMRDAANQTALFWASSSGHSSVVKALVDAHADVNAQNENGGTALHMACSLGYEEVLVILLAAKANVWLQDQDGWTSLHHAAKHGLVYAVRALLSESKNRGSSGMNSAGHTTAHDGNQSQTSEARAMEGIVFSHTQNIRQLPDTSSKVKGYVPDEERDTAPELVPRDGRSICSARTNIGVRAIHLAAAYGHYEVAKSLLVADKDDGYRTLHGSACNGTGSINVADTPALPTAATHADSIPPLEVSEKLRWYCRLTSIYPEDHFFRKDLADMYIRAGMIPLAVSSFDIALTLDPFSAAAILVGEIIHRNKCDSCDVKRITGYRHKCLTCPDYDLCDNCFQVTPRPHSSHNFITIPSQEWVSKGL